MTLKPTVPMVRSSASLIGAEMNAEIEHASPWGKAPGENVPGQRKKIGAAAARAYDQGTSRVRSLDRERAPISPVGLYYPGWVARCSLCRWLPSRRRRPRDRSDDTPGVPQR